MARRKTPKNETPEEMLSRKRREKISSIAERAAKVAWKRSQQRMQKYISFIDEVNDKIAILEDEKIAALDEVANIRTPMVEGCIHPFEQLVDKGDYVECKFCGKKIVINDNEEEKV